MTNRKIQYWVIPPEADAEFAANMEDVLDIYSKPYNPRVPVLCMDEQPVQLIKETKTPIEATLTHAKRVDYEYERAGTANILCLPNRVLVGDTSACGNGKRKSIGRSRWRTCWRVDTAIAKG